MKKDSNHNDLLFKTDVKGREIFDFMIDSAIDGFWYWNLKNRSKDWINDRFWETLGYTGQEIPRDTAAWESVIFPEDLITLSERYKLCFSDPEQQFEIILRFRHKKGRTVWMRTKGKAIRNDDNEVVDMQFAHFDVTKEKVKESYLTSCNTAANIGYWEVDLIKSDVLWSPVTKKIHRVSEDYEPDLETAINFFKKGEHRDLVTKLVTEAIEYGKEYKFETILITASGEERWVNSIGISEVANGKCVRLYGTFQDIHERKKSELEILSLLQTSNEQNKRLRNFKNIVSHNLRSHSGNLEFLIDLIAKDKPELNELEVFQLIKDASSNLSETIVQLNRVSRITGLDASQLELLSLSKHVQKAVAATMGLAHGAGVEIIDEVETDLNVLGVSSYLESIVLNFLTNSIKYKANRKKSYVKLFTSHDKEKITLHIEDNGLGIDLNRHRDELFGMYKVFHDHPDSIGLGLFITKNQIDAIDATVDVASQVDKGTTFKINFAYEKN